MRVIVTGAGGFIGSVLCEHLNRAGHEVVRFYHRIPNHPNPDGSVADIACNVLSDDLSKLRVSADAVIHLASANDIVSKNARQGIELSVMGTKHVLDMAVNNSIDKFIFFSTIQVLGTELEGEITEQTPVNPQNDYAMNHWLAEQYVSMYAKTGKLRAVTVRPTNVFGRFAAESVDRWSLVPACFCREAFHNKTITIRSSGKQARNFICVDSVAEAVSALLDHFPGIYDIVHVGSSSPMTILQVAALVKLIHDQMYEEKTKLIIEGTEPQSTNQFELSLKHMRDKYGFQYVSAETSLQQQIRLIFKGLEKQQYN